jgi:hypothetical protein
LTADPIEAHTTVLAGINHQINIAELVVAEREGRPANDPLIAARAIAVPTSTLAALTGRRRILERHAPAQARLHWGSRATASLTEAVCRDHTRPGRIATWPCPDYRDAAADLLPQEDT